MVFNVKLQESYSRLELILRSLFGMLYIAIPHFFLLFFVGLWSAILNFLAFWVILFTGRYPESWFEFQVKLIKWQMRVNLRLFNLADGYPSFGLTAEDENLELNIEYPERLSRGHHLLKVLFGGLYVILPHGIILMFRFLISQFFVVLSWFVVLFTGRYPESFFNFIVGTLRWNLRVTLYMSFLTDAYPPFSGKPDDQLALA